MLVNVGQNLVDPAIFLGQNRNAPDIGQADVLCQQSQKCCLGMEFVGQIVGCVASAQESECSGCFLVALHPIGKLQKLGKRVIGIQIKMDPMLFKFLSRQVCIAVSYSGRNEEPVSRADSIKSVLYGNLTAAFQKEVELMKGSSVVTYDPILPLLQPEMAAFPTNDIEIGDIGLLQIVHMISPR